MFSRPKLGSDEEMINLKQKSPFWDKRLGVTYQCGDLQFVGKNAERKFCYPLQKGTQGFCESAAKRLKNLGVELLLNELCPKVVRGELEKKWRIWFNM